MEERKAEGKIGVSFSAGGWLMNYLFGVAKGLQRVGVQDHCRLIGVPSLSSFPFLFPLPPFILLEFCAIRARMRCCEDLCSSV